ncbi:MAG: trypsin-like peptidase domain-containing protein, partial [Clostridia bacterium]|nr:trypsin-like peptidase domain-containing protein [Clostridia bacterium]
AATGSGVIVYKNLVLTNFHVVQDATRLTVSTLVSKDEYAATLVSYDEAADLALIHVPELALPAVPLGDSDQLQVGEWALCIGNPLMEELRGTVTAGIVSAIDRQIDSNTTTDKYGLKRTVTNSMIQIDAAINSGNSGGGMFNVLGQLMGIPSQKYSGSYFSGSSIEGIGLCIPINAAKTLISEAIVSIETGELTENNKSGKSVPSTNPGAKNSKPALGISVHAVTNTNDYFVYEGALPGGIMIDEVQKNSPAEAAGLMPYDIIVEVDGEITNSTSVITQALNSHKIGDTLKVKIYRVENYENAKSISDLGEGEYIDFEVELFEFNINT